MANVDTTVSRRVTPNLEVERGRQRPTELTRFHRKQLAALTLFSGDVLAALITLLLCRKATEWLGVSPDRTIPILVLPFVFVALGLYARSGDGPYNRFRLRVLGIGGFVALSLAAGLPVSNPTYLLLALAAQASCALPLGHYFEAIARRLLVRADLWGARTVLVGCNDDSRKLAAYLKQRPALGLNPVGVLAAPTDDDARRSQFPLPVIGSLSEPDRIREEIEAVIFTSGDDLNMYETRCRLLAPARRVLLVNCFSGDRASGIPVQTADGIIGVELRHGIYLRHNLLLKRIMDILIAVPLATLSFPIIAVLGLAISIVDPGPIFYIQKRVGRNGANFGVIKLRTMYRDAEPRLQQHLLENPQARAEWDRYFKLRDDPRVLPVIGSVMRRSSLDELPQIWNVIRGDMSLVGPRPFPSYHLQSFDSEFRSLRASVPPGITGVWQTSTRSNGDLQIQRAEDLFYIRNWSLLLDIYLLLQTIPAVLSGEGAR